jgi:WD40 repeat protein
MVLGWSSLKRALLLLLLAMAVLGCESPEFESEVTPTPDIALLETRTEAQLAARLTAIAPEPTPSPFPTEAPETPIPTPQPTLTPTAIPTGSAPPLVIVNRLPNESGNVVVPSWAGEETVLTHFTEPMSIYSLRWTTAEDRLAMVSSHDFAYSRTNERNVFLMRADGADLEMVTGDYLPPEQALGPFRSLEGRVEGSAGVCRVTAQGLGSLVNADESGTFLLEGVSESAVWARAICQEDTVVYQGTADLTLNQGTAPVVITVTPAGQGWRDVSFSPDARQFVGTYYRWRLDEQGEVAFDVQGVLYDVKAGEYGTLQVPEGAAFLGAAWSPNGQRIVGGLADEESAYLWQWDLQGASVGKLFKIDNPEDQILTIVRPVWSPDGVSLAFELHRWYWWSGEKFRTDVMTIGADGQNAATPLEAEWGWHATHLSWGSEGASLFYQYYASETDLGGLMPETADIWSVDLDSLTPSRWTEDGSSFLPAVRPAQNGF